VKKPPENPDHADVSADPPEKAEEPAVRVDFDAIEVGDIRAVEYRTRRRRVRQYEAFKDDRQF